MQGIISDDVGHLLMRLESSLGDQINWYDSQISEYSSWDYIIYRSSIGKIMPYLNLFPAI